MENTPVRISDILPLTAVQTAIVLTLVFTVKNGTLSHTGLIATILALCALFIVSVGLSIRSKRAVDRANRRNRMLGDFAAEINQVILLNENEGKVFSTVLDYTFLILEKVNLGSVLAFNEEGKLVVTASRGFSEQYVRNFSISLKDTFQYRQSGGLISEAMIIKPGIIKKFSDKLDTTNPEYKSIISVPLFVGGELYGFLNVDSLEENSFGKEDLDLLKRFGAQIEVSLLVRERYRASLEKSHIDGLTRFLSRAYFTQMFDHALEHAKRYKGKFALGMFDADGLKTINDTFGHTAGDRILKAIADAIRRTARKSDVIGRYGGDEFVGIYFNADAESMTAQTMATTAELRASPVLFGNQTLEPSFSFGFADYPGDAETFEDLVAAADARMYAMKAEKKGNP
jgi:diguanylate cyclase (GGDEF)-like protein